MTDANASAMFHNFTSEPFTGFWNGKPHTFKAGEKKYMPYYLAEHFGKHLTNRELLRTGHERAMSPKFPAQVPEFMNLFKQACIVEEEDADETDQATAEIAMANRGRGEPSMNIDVKPRQVVDPYDASSQKPSASGAPIVIGEVADEDEEFEEAAKQ